MYILYTHIVHIYIYIYIHIHIPLSIGHKHQIAAVGRTTLSPVEKG